MAANDLSALNGNFKKQFHGKVEELIPDPCILQREDMISWVDSEKMNGEFYAIPTLLRSNQGVTYLGQSGSVGTLKDARPGQMKEAQVYGSELNVRGQLSYKALSQASAAGPKAFKKSMAWLVEDLAQVAYVRWEIATLYGQSGLGTVETATDLTGGLANIVITAGSFAPGIWVLLEGATLDAFTGTTKNNSSGVLIVQTVTTSTRTVKVSFTGTLADEVDPDDELYFEGANLGSSSFNEIVGLYKQMTTVSGTLFNIDRGAYSLMQGNVKASVGQPTRAKLVDAAMLAVDKGYLGELVCLVSSKTWTALHNEDAALRVFDSSYDSELIFSKVGGNIKIVCHPMLKPAHFMMFPTETVIFCGSSKPTFEIPGKGGEEFFRTVENSNAVELQNFSDMAVYVIKPCHTVVGTGLTHA
jgi:hypothetical protein